MSKNIDMDLVALAAAVGGEMNKIDQSVVNKGTVAVGQAKKINPRDFVPGNKPTNQGSSTRNIAGNAMIQAPKSTPAGRDVVGTVDFDPSTLVIPMPEDMEAQARQIEAAYVPPPVRENAVPRVLQEQATAVFPEITQSEITYAVGKPTIDAMMKLLKTIDKKLNKIIKQTK